MVVSHGKGKPISCTGYLTHLFGKSHRPSDRASFHELGCIWMCSQGKIWICKYRFTVQQENQCISLKEQFIVFLSRLKRLVGTSVKVLCARCVHWTKPLSSSLPLGTLADLGRSKSEFIAENALLRQQLIMLKRQVKRPVCTKTDRLLLVLLARVVRAWKQALLIAQPETLLRWHREAFHLYWRHKSKAHSHKPKVATE